MIPQRSVNMAPEVKTNNDFVKELKINPLELDKEFIEQPEKFYKYAEMLAEANKEYDECKLRLEVIQAQVDSEIRSRYENAVKKPTETAIRGEVVQNIEYQQAYRELTEKKKGVDTISGGVRAFEQRKVSLENLAKLWAQSYFAGPKQPVDISVRNQK